MFGAMLQMDYLANAAGGVAATGGTVTTVGGYKYHTFTTSGTLTVTAGGAIEYLILAGGGGAGNNAGYGSGGGGAGGYRALSATIGTGAFAVAVGSGGSGGTARATKEA